MKVQRVFCIYDRVAESSAPPIFCRNEAEAIRSVERSFTSAYSNIPAFRHTDFALYEIGDYDPTTCKLTPLDKPRDIFFDYLPPEVSNGKTSNNPL